MDFHEAIRHVIDSSIFTRTLVLLGVLVFYGLSIVVYRLYFHPLASVPGPKLAAISALPAMYHDIIRGGQYIWEIEKMHKQYGPVIRIRPNTVHINDPQYLDAVYGSNTKRRHKSQLHCNSFGNPLGSVATYDHDLHRRRRAATAPYFSMAAVRRLEPIVLEALVKVLNILRDESSNLPKEPDHKSPASTTSANEGMVSEPSKPINPNLLFSAATADIITEYAFGDSWNNLDMNDWNVTFFNFVKEGSKMWHVNSYFPFVMKGLLALPVPVARKLVPGMGHVLKFFGLLDRDLEKLKQGQQPSSISEKDEQNQKPSNSDQKPTVFNSLLSPSLPASERTNARLLCEAKVLLAAGTDTTAMTLTKILYHILADPAIYSTLRTKLITAVPGPNVPSENEEWILPTLSQVENLPYLNAVIQEGLRLHPAGSMRQERIAPDEDVVLAERETGKTWIIPRGYSLAMSAPLLARLETLYPDHLAFNPSRWLSSSDSTLIQDHTSLTFSRGPRTCLGINLAWTELRLFLAGLVRNFDGPPATASVEAGREEGKKRWRLELTPGTTREDVDLAADFGIPFIKGNREGVRVYVRYA